VKAYLHYRDDGPGGPCGQTMSVTSPWSRLYVYDGENAEADARALIVYLQERRAGFGRRNARIEAFWFEEDGNVLAGPVVPALERNESA
jgi:hypothetical protein